MDLIHRHVVSLQIWNDYVEGLVDRKDVVSRINKSIRYWGRLNKYELRDIREQIEDFENVRRRREDLAKIFILEFKKLRSELPMELHLMIYEHADRHLEHEENDLSEYPL